MDLNQSIESINYLAVIVSALSAFFIGGLSMVFCYMRKSLDGGKRL